MGGNKTVGRHIVRRASYFVVSGALALCATLVQAVEYHVDTTRPRSVKFISDAPLENFDGVTSRIDGYSIIPSVTLQLGKGYDSSRFYFEVDLNALDTGIGLRNRHMRENYLETDQFPFAQYDGRVSEVRQGPDSSLLVSTTGEFTIHGVKRAMVGTITAVLERGRYHVRTQFPVALPDHKIKVPKLMFLKISDTVQVQLDFYLLPITNSGEGR
jgi:polyisoprenoid-binding protein YceI